MDIEVTQIGVIQAPAVQATDEYVLLTRRDEDLSPEQAQEWLLQRCYRDTSSPGGYFCHRVQAVQKPNASHEVICIIEHRYDI